VTLAQQLRDFLAGLGPLGVLLVSFVESCGIPNPGGTDWMLVWLTIGRPEKAAAFVAMATLGSLAGSVIFYYIIRKGGEKLLDRYTSSGRGARFRVWFQHYGLVTVFIAALLPLPIMPFKVFAACAGALGVGLRRFLTVIALARVPRYVGLAFLALQVGYNWQSWLKAHMWHMLLTAVVLFAVLYWGTRRAESRIAQAAAAPEA
jgi:membrane protein YqaA with SNARE-associated domain